MNSRSPLLVLLLLTSVILLASVSARGQGGASSVEDTRHNLTASGPGPVKTSVGGESCRFCHTPHASRPVAPLWNRQDPGSFYQPYTSSTLKASVGQPTGSSRLCLSCHDGTIALQQTYNSLNDMGSGAVYISPQDAGYIGTDLSDDHPVSLEYDASLAMIKGEMRDPSTLPADLPLDRDGQLQCTTCHDPHDNSFGDFLRMSNEASLMCTTCHTIDGWAASDHATSLAGLADASWDNWDNLDAATVRAAGCGSCHRPHSAGGRQRLVRHQAEEANCLNCHDGSVAEADIAGEVNKLSRHASQMYTGVHDPMENPLTMREHVECADCHDPHTVADGAGANPPFVRDAMAGASGVTASGASVDIATYEYEVCYKCHGVQNFADPIVDRVLGTDDVSNEFDLANASYHPVEGQGRNNDVPSLLQGYTTGSVIYCTDCHGSDDPQGATGPHGSRFAPLLKRQYSTADGTGESPSAYASCYACHNRASILADESFPEHRLHIVDERTPCATCHDPHGVTSQTHLINFDRDVVDPSGVTGGDPIFEDLGSERGSCTLSCHGAEHNDERY